ncbi:MAG: endonuclease VII domain-containing protein [Chloroflexi bacterium]|nr:endonuclease VII domain-containing protein [Chloroflexota bacterium]
MYKLKSRHGLSLEEYDAILASQNNECAICGRLCQNGSRLVVDHDHASGTIRGLLCHNCNLVLGKLEDRPRWFENAAQYLRGGNYAHWCAPYL